MVAEHRLRFNSSENPGMCPLRCGMHGPNCPAYRTCRNDFKSSKVQTAELIEGPKSEN